MNRKYRNESDKVPAFKSLTGLAKNNGQEPVTQAFIESGVLELYVGREMRKANSES